jgi:hypothetical protein
MGVVVHHLVTSLVIVEVVYEFDVIAEEAEGDPPVAAHPDRSVALEAFVPEADNHTTSVTRGVTGCRDLRARQLAASVCRKQEGVAIRLGSFCAALEVVEECAGER